MRLAGRSSLWRPQPNPSKFPKFLITLKKKAMLNAYKIQNEVLENEFPFEILVFGLIPNYHSHTSTKSSVERMESRLSVEQMESRL